MRKLLLIATLVLATTTAEARTSAVNCEEIRGYAQAVGVETLKRLAKQFGYTEKQIEGALKGCKINH